MKKLSALLLVFVCLALCTAPVSADGEEAASTLPAEAERGVRGEGYTSVLYDSTAGLPTSDANAIAQSAEGFIWFGSYSGLIRYDGNEFHRYPSSTGVSSVVSLFYDSQGRLWIGTNDKGICCLKNEQFTYYFGDSALTSSSIRSITEDEEGNILIATTSGLAYVDTEGTLHALDDPQTNREYICELANGADGVIYGVTLGGSFFTVDKLRVTAWYSGETLGFGVINTVYPDPQDPGRVYLGTQDARVIHGSLSAGMADSSVLSVEPLTQVNSIRRLGGLLWICTDNGIGYLDESGGFRQLLDIPMNNSVDRVMEDYEGNLWFISSRQGVMKIVPNRFTDVFGLAELPDQVVNANCLAGGLLYIGADTGLTILDGNYKCVHNELTELLRGARIRSIRSDSRGILWFCTNSDKGLVRYDPADGSIRLYTTENGLASNRPRIVLELSDGRMAIATNAGVNLMENDEITSVYNGAQGISNTEILTLEEAPDGRLYFGSDGDGIYVAGGGQVSRIGRAAGLDSEVILRLKRDPEEEGLFWVITSSSIGVLRDGTVRILQSFPYSNNFDLFFDDNGRVWVLSSNGIYVVKRDELLADRVVEYTLYDTSCGLPCAATANSYSDLREDGTLFIAAARGVSSVNICVDPDDTRQVRLAVPFITADEAYIFPDGDGAFHVPASCRRLSISAYAFTYTLNNPHVSYYLEGFDPAPIVVTKREMDHISYTNLAGGTYRFHMSLLNTLTGAEEQPLTVTIVKDKLLYEQAWFRALAMLLTAALAAGAAALFYRRRTRALLKKQEEHRQLINEMSSVFASCIDMKDSYTNGHSHRVAKYTAMLAERLGKSKEEIEEIYNIALLHDIGKISIPDSILNKPGKLTDEEFAVMKNHSQRGYEILRDVAIDPNLSLGAGYHHERVDGSGYPRGLKGDEIPEIARIIAVADTFDAMYSTRPYRKKLGLDVVASEIQRSSGTQLSEPVVAAFMELVREGAFDNE